MVNRKGFLAATLCLSIWMVPVSADETADDIVAMMGWWQEYGRYWDEIGADTAGIEDDIIFAELEEVVDEVVEGTIVAQGAVEQKVVVAKRSQQ